MIERLLRTGFQHSHELTARMFPVEAATAPAKQSPTDPGALFDAASAYLSGYLERIQTQLSSSTVWYQVAAIAGALLVGFLLARSIRVRIEKYFEKQGDRKGASRFRGAVQRVAPAALAAALLWMLMAAYGAADLPISVMRIVANLLAAWVVIRAFSGMVSNPFASRTIAVMAWVAAALNILRLLDPTIELMKAARLPFIETISFFDIVKGLVVAIALVWGANAASRVVEAKLRSSKIMTPSVRGLFAQLARILMIGVAIFIALDTIGINLTAFAVFTGALGVGVGFGLQSIFSNFVAGLIIIFEKTLKVGDFVDLESGVRGEVKEINVRSTLITTNDNIDILVPNSEFVNNRVTNWTLRDAKRRLHVPFGVAYGTDKNLVKRAVLEAAESVEFTLRGVRGREADVWLVNFGDSALDFELVVWLTDDATKRPARVQAAYCWAIETALTKYGIVIPFPQRDLHIIAPPAPAQISA